MLGQVEGLILKMKNLFGECGYMEEFPNSGLGYGIEPIFDLSFRKDVCTQKYDIGRDISTLVEDVRRKSENG